MLSEVIAYAADCRIIGTITFAEDERLSDVINESERLFVTDARLISHADGHAVDLEELRIEREELYAIEAVGSRGSTDRRIHTVKHRLEIRLGPYTVLGHLHARPGSDPLLSIGRRPSMIPLTDATIAYNGSDGVEAKDIDTLIVNRDVADWVRADESDLAAFDGVKVAAPAV
jgi:hypothetical protein